ncbi:MAG: hypothetical protein NTX14_03155 [Candidatus Nealsonbacteria bacterium]|nr:hypothetical protein [Candidatus Nealsonbacteria bacterium]
MDQILPKIFYWLKKPRTVIILGDKRASAAEAVFFVLSKHGKAKKIGSAWPFFVARDETIIAEKDITVDRDFKEAIFLAGNSSLLVIVLTSFGSLDGKDRLDDLKSFLAKIDNQGKIVHKEIYIVYNADQPDLKKMLGPITAGNKASFGFSPEADFRASDVHVAKALNFKANVKGNIIPVWLNRATTEEQVFSALAALTVGRVFGLNLIQTTQAIKDFCPAS